eukprot:5329615-Lingulodinium_polyedra.AAC.1
MQRSKATGNHNHCNTHIQQPYNNRCTYYEINKWLYDDDGGDDDSSMHHPCPHLGAEAAKPALER